MKLHRFCSSVRAAVALACFSFTLPFSFLAAEPFKTEQSWFEKDEQGILWFRQGNDGETKYSASLVLSAVTDGIVITVTANEEHIDNAVKLAMKMRKVLQRNEHTPNDIPIVAWKDNLPGVGYTFYTDGMGVGREHIYANNGVFKPAKAKSKEVLSLVVKQYRILREMAVEGRWGQEDGEEAVLNIRPK